MTFRLRHEWHDGRRVNGSTLATCAHCATLRVTLEVEGRSRVHYIRRLADDRGVEMVRSDIVKPETDPDARVTLVEPRCLSPAEHFRAPW